MKLLGPKSAMILSITMLLLGACTPVNQIGKVNMISNRNVDPNLKYERLTTYSGGSEKELKKSKAETIEEAVDNTVRKIPGGEFLMNVKIYLIGDDYFAVEGDVWGKPGPASYRGFEIGDRVTWEKKTLSTALSGKAQYLTGTIKALKDDKHCLVDVDDSDETVELSYDDITLVE